MRQNKMRKRLLTLGIVFIMLIPILQNSQALVLASTEKSTEEQYAYQLNGKMLGGQRRSLRMNQPNMSYYGSRIVPKPRFMLSL